MNYIERNTRFYEALKSKDNKVINEEFGGVRKALIDFLIYTRGADRPSAEDAVSIAFLKLLEMIESDRIEKKSSLYSWLMNASKTIFRDEKNKLLNRITDKEDFNEDHYLEPSEQIDLMRDPERQRLLKLCMEKLSADMKATMEYLIRFPDMSLENLSKKLKVSYITIRQRKTRITHQLHDCVQEKLQR
ncbi:MAG: hypothetical protein WD267_07860 [Balneolales bacterium]